MKACLYKQLCEKTIILCEKILTVLLLDPNYQSFDKTRKKLFTNLKRGTKCHFWYAAPINC